MSEKSQQTQLFPSMSSSEDSHVKTYQSLGDRRVYTQNDQDCGLKWLESFGYFDPDTQSLRTWQTSLDSDWNECLPTLPRWGEMRHGQLYLHPQSEQITGVIEYLSCHGLPTIAATEYKGASKNRFRGSPHYKGTRMVEALRNGPTDPSRISIHFAEVQMGFPRDYTKVE